VLQESAAASRFCHLCGQPLTGHYFRNKRGLVFCASCSATRQRCVLCATPLGEADLAQARHNATEDGMLCRQCARMTPRCAACHRHIAGTFYTFEELLPPAAIRRFCAGCARSRPRCDICRAPVAQDTAALDDGQYRCALCAEQMVLGEPAVRTVYAQALAALGHLVGAPPAPPRLEVVSRLQMGELRRRHERDVPTGPAIPAASHHVLGYFVRTHGANTIYVERGLPRSLLLGTLAHELGHAWQAAYPAAERDPVLAEGFAEWIAHHTLVASGLRPVAARATRRDDVYGRGLRQMLEVERHAGSEAVLALARGEAK